MCKGQQFWHIHSLIATGFSVLTLRDNTTCRPK